MNLSIGSTGDEVLDLQKKLNAVNAGVAGYTPLVEDSQYGPKTQAAVAAYQKANNLTVDGIAGNQTLGSLNTPVVPTAPVQNGYDPAKIDALIVGVDKSKGTQPIQQQPGQVSNVPDFKPPKIQTYQQSPEIQKALDDYNAWAQQPYVSKWAPQIEEKVNEILSRTFNYDPATDAQLGLATKNLTRQVLETMNSRGILNSTITENQLQQGIADLMPQYKQMAQQQFQNEGQVLMSQIDMLTGMDETGYSRYMDEGEKLAKGLDAVMKMDDTQYQRWKDAYETRYQQYKDSYNASLDKIDAQRTMVQDAWDRTSELGYVDNKSSITLGIPAGTLSKEAREAKIQRAQEIEDQKTEQKNQLAVIEAQYQKERKLAAARESNSGSTKTTDITKMGTPAQVSQYNQLLDIYMGGGSGKYANDPYAAYQWLTTHRADNAALVGDKLYNQLVSTVEDAMKMQKSYSGEPTTAQKTSQQQTDIDNSALAESIAQAKAGTFITWFEDYGSDLAQQVSTTTYKKLMADYNAAIKAKAEADFNKSIGAD